MPLPNPFYPQLNNTYQQMLQQYQQSMTSQSQTTVFYNVPSEEVARRWDLPPNTTGNFINTNEKYIYIKTSGSSMLEPYKFTKIRLEEETEDGIVPQVSSSEPPIVNLDNYITKEELDNKLKPYENTIKEMQEVVKELKG